MEMSNEIITLRNHVAKLQAENKLLTDRLAVYDATDIPETIKENERLKAKADLYHSVIERLRFNPAYTIQFNPDTLTSETAIKEALKEKDNEA
jgi:hypothetical protein